MRILRLPMLCTLEIFENWNLFELYKFSALSKRARAMSKLKKFPTPEKIIIATYEGFSLSVVYSTSVQWHFSFTNNESSSDNHRDDPCKKKPISYEKRTFFFQDPVQGGFQFAEFLIHLFNVSVAEVQFYTYKANNSSDLENTVEWINDQKDLEMKKATIFAKSNDLLPLVVQKYKKKTDIFLIWAEFVNDKPDPAAIFSPMLELNELSAPALASNVYGMNLDFLLSSNFPRINMSGKSMTCQDINTFLHGWKNEKTNTKLKCCELEMCCRIDMRAILEGLNPIFQDSNTTKTPHREGNLVCYSYSGIEIQRIDGKRANLSAQTCFLEDGEDLEIHQEVRDEHGDSEESKEGGEEKYKLSQNCEWHFWIEIE
ncbi:unnamed protein product [Caenorhabditis brenneri]